MIETALLAIGLVLIVEGLAYALAPWRLSPAWPLSGWPSCLRASGCDLTASPAR